MRQLLPEHITEVDPVALYTADVRARINDRPWVVVNMITSIDGATAVDGRSGGLGGPADKAVFRALREVPDVILVGAWTRMPSDVDVNAANARSRVWRWSRVRWTSTRTR
jgi:RibD C-terminal domain